MNKLRVWLICGRPAHKIGVLVRSEKGVALPLVLALLFIGSLILTPFLTHAGANLTSSNHVFSYVQRKICR